MELAVDLDDQPGRRAVEVDDVLADRDLAAESMAEAAASDLAPEQALGKRHVAAELAGAVEHRASLWKSRADRKLTR